MVIEKKKYLFSCNHILCTVVLELFPHNLHQLKKYHFSFDTFQNISFRDQGCDEYARRLTCLENLSSDDKNVNETNWNLNTTVTFLSNLAEVPGEQITKNETTVGKVTIAFCYNKTIST